MKKTIVTTILCSICIYAQDSLFMIDAFQVTDTVWFDTARDNLHLNTVSTGHTPSEQWIKDYLNAAEGDNLNVILHKAFIENGQRLHLYCDIWHSIWESEEDSIYFKHDIGNAVHDSYAANDTALVCTVGMGAGTMQWGRDTCTFEMRISTRTFWDWSADTYYDSLEYTATFALKIDTAGSGASPSTEVCTLLINFDYNDSNIDTIVQTRVLTVDSFATRSATGKYDSFYIDFKKANGTNNVVCPGILYCNNVDLWADNVEIKDERFDSLKNHLYDQDLDSMFLEYDPETYPKLLYYFLKDEPHFGHMQANAYITSFLRDPQTYNDKVPGVEYVGGGHYPYPIDGEGRTIFEAQADSIQPKFLWMDDYPFYGDSSSHGPVPEDSGTFFQATIDTHCYRLAEMCSLAVNRDKYMVHTVQSYAVYKVEGAPNPDSGGLEMWWRYPTPREIRLNVWLGLAYGAKGILYYKYGTAQQTDMGKQVYHRGLWRHDNTRREPMFSAVANINQGLEEIGPTLMELDIDTVFKHVSGQNIPFCCIKAIHDDSIVQVGTSHNDNSDTFFIMVNRLCRDTTTEHETLSVQMRKDSILLCDLVSGDAIAPDSAPNGEAYFTLHFNPGQGKLFQLVPFAQEFTINSNQAYANMPFAVCSTKVWSAKTIDSMKISQEWYGPPAGRADDMSMGWDPEWNYWVIYAADTTHKLYKSVDEGEYWDSIYLDENIIKPTCVITQPANAQIVYIGKNDATPVWWSTNGGQTWEPRSGTGGNIITNENPRCFCMDPNNSSVIYLGCGTGACAVFKTTDGGNDWSALTNFPDTKVNDIVITHDPLRGTWIIVGCEYGSYKGIWLSTNGGTNWSPKLSGQDVHSLSFASQSIGYAGTGNDLYKTEDGGGYWSPIGNFSSVTAVAAVNASEVYIAAGGANGFGIYRTTDGGSSWPFYYGRNDSLFCNDKVIEILIHPNYTTNHQVFTAGDWAVYRLDDPGADWQEIIYGFKILKPETISNKD